MAVGTHTQDGDVTQGGVVFCSDGRRSAAWGPILMYSRRLLKVLSLPQRLVLDRDTVYTE